ncbi:unnamed protein product [Boreogadus saida]
MEPKKEGENMTALLFLLDVATRTSPRTRILSYLLAEADARRSSDGEQGRPRFCMTEKERGLIDETRLTTDQRRWMMNKRVMQTDREKDPCRTFYHASCGRAPPLAKATPIDVRAEETSNRPERNERS